jgi:hypothetical protein
VLPSWQVAHYLADGRLKIALETYQRPPTPLRILTLRNGLFLPKVHAFVDFLQQHWLNPAYASPSVSDEASRVVRATRWLNTDFIAADFAAKIMPGETTTSAVSYLD